MQKRRISRELKGDGAALVGKKRTFGTRSPLAKSRYWRDVGRQQSGYPATCSM
jgi:hypothetical protein